MRHLLISGALVLSLVSNGFGGILTAQEDVLDFGTVGQNSAGITNGGMACGPTSVFNSFMYLQNHFGITGLLQQGAASITINQLGAYMGGTDPKTTGTPADGVTSAELVAGKTAYIAAQGLAGSISVESQSNAIAGNHVTVEFMYQQLALGQDVEIKFNWNGGDNAGAHFVTVTGINFDTDTDEGTLNILDPWNEGGVGGASFIAANLTGNDADGFTISYSGGAAGVNDDPDNPDDAGSGTIFSVAAESPVPEPSSLVVFGLGGGVLAVVTKRRRRLMVQVHEQNRFLETD